MSSTHAGSHRSLRSHLAALCLSALCLPVLAVGAIVPVSAQAATSDQAGLIATAMGGTGQIDYANWQRFKGQGFTVLMPGKPKLMTQSTTLGDGTPITLKLYIVESKMEAYLASHTPAPAGTSIDLNAAIASSAAKIGGKILDKKSSKVAGRPALDAVITFKTPAGAKAFYLARLVDTGSGILQLVHTTGTGDKKVRSTNKKFMNSLTLS